MKCKCGNDAMLIRGNKGATTQCSRCWRESTLETTLSVMSIHKAFRGARIDDFKKLLSNYDTSESFFFHGTAGVGKTHMAVALLVEDILNTPANMRLNVEFTTMLNLLSQIRSTYSKSHGLTEDELLKHYCNLETLYIDDIGVEQTNDWSLSKVYQIIDYRWGNDLRTIITSNFDLNAISEKIDSRIASRIEGMCNVIELTGKDKRCK